MKEREHVQDRPLDADDGRPGDDGKADAELGDLGNGHDRTDVPVVEAMAAVDLESDLVTECGRLPDGLESLLPRRAFLEVGVGTGIDLDEVDADLPRRLDLLEIRVDEDARPDARLPQRPDVGSQGLPVRRDLQSPFRRQLLGPLGHERDDVGPDLERDSLHLVRRGHLHVELGLEGVPQQPQVPLLDVPPVAADMADDAVGAGLLREQGREHGLGLGGLAGLPQRREMVDVDGQSHVISPRCAGGRLRRPVSRRNRRWPGRGPRP